MTNDQIEAFIKAHLPASFGELVAMKPGGDGWEYYRGIDKALQRMRKRGEIAFVRHRNQTIWNVVTAND